MQLAQHPLVRPLPLLLKNRQHLTMIDEGARVHCTLPLADDKPGCAQIHYELYEWMSCAY